MFDFSPRKLSAYRKEIDIHDVLKEHHKAEIEKRILSNRISIMRANQDRNICRLNFLVKHVDGLKQLKIERREELQKMNECKNIEKEKENIRNQQMRWKIKRGKIRATVAKYELMGYNKQITEKMRSESKQNHKLIELNQLEVSREKRLMKETIRKQQVQNKSRVSDFRAEKLRSLKSMSSQDLAYHLQLSQKSQFEVRQLRDEEKRMVSKFSETEQFFRMSKLILIPSGPKMRSKLE